MTPLDDPLQIKHCNTLQEHPQHEWFQAFGVGQMDHLTCDGKDIRPKAERALDHIPYRPINTVQHDIASLGGARTSLDEIVAMTYMPEDQYVLRLSALTGTTISRDNGLVSAQKQDATLLSNQHEDAGYLRAQKEAHVARHKPEYDYLNAMRAYLDPNDELEGTDLGYILFTLMPDLAQQLINAGKHYGYTNHQKLGVRAQYVDLHRKMGPIRDALWADPPRVLTREPLTQILMDLAGHAFLTRAMLDRGSEDGSYDNDL